MSNKDKNSSSSASSDSSDGSSDSDSSASVESGEIKISREEVAKKPNPEIQADVVKPESHSTTNDPETNSLENEEPSAKKPKIDDTTQKETHIKSPATETKESDIEEGECANEVDPAATPDSIQNSLVITSKVVEVGDTKESKEMQKADENANNKSTEKSADKSSEKKTDKDKGTSQSRRGEMRKREEERRRRHRSRSYTRSRSRERRPQDRTSPRRGGGRNSKEKKVEETKKIDPEVIPRRQQRTVDLLTSKTGGAYIPPAKLRMLQAEITDKSSAAYQRIAWEALKKSIHGYINKVNVDNIGIITRELLKENIVRGRGLICKSIIQAQAASPTFTHVYAALVSVINSKFPNIGELLLKRLVIQFKRGFRRNDKTVCLSASRFIAHLVNQRVAHEILALEILTLLVETPTDDSVEVAIAFLKESGMKLQEVSSKGVNAIFEMLKNILHEGRLDKRVQYMIEVVFQVRKDGFKDHVAVPEALELVEEDDQFTHLIMLDEATDAQDVLSKFHNTHIFMLN